VKPRAGLRGSVAAARWTFEAGVFHPGLLSRALKKATLMLMFAIDGWLELAVLFVP
jgi:hypothetical protein